MCIRDSGQVLFGAGQGGAGCLGVAAQSGGFGQGQSGAHLGVVGPVRTGKSTFIKKFMDLMVLPSVEESYAKERMQDELPQSGSGRTIMTLSLIHILPGHR